ncbi:MAG: Uma2 family endonuclease [Gloeobacterales cyanobacterium]
MIAIPDKQQMSPAEYLLWETQQQVKHEYIDGHAYAMTGGTLAHSIIGGNLFTLLKNHLRGGSCTAFNSDAKVLVSANGPFFYPDVSVTCNAQDLQAIDFIQNPCLIAEVLSPGTQGFDRGDKFTYYRRIGMLREYLLISSERVEVEIFRLNERAKWELTPYVAEEEIELTSVDCRFPIELLYEGIQLPLQKPF